MRFGLYIPPFDSSPIPRSSPGSARRRRGPTGTGSSCWDQLRWREPVDVGDPQITLAAIAAATERIRLGPMVTPLARRRPAKTRARPRPLTG